MDPKSHLNQAIGRPWSSVLRYCEVLKEGVFVCFWASAKSRRTIAMISELGRQIEKTWLDLEGSAGEAACRGRERVGVSKIACICFRIQHAAPRESADLRATASAADPYQKPCWWILYCMLVLRVKRVLWEDR